MAALYKEEYASAAFLIARRVYYRLPNNHQELVIYLNDCYKCIAQLKLLTQLYGIENTGEFITGIYSRINFATRWVKHINSVITIQ